MFKVRLFDPDESQSWLIRKFEEFRFDGEFLSEKFVPRPDISLMFHFNDRPFISAETPVTLAPFFASPILAKSLDLNFHGEMDSFVVVCRPTVLSKIFNLDLSSIMNRYINLPEELFRPLWMELALLDNTPERISLFSDFLNKFYPKTYERDSADILFDKIIEKGIGTLLKEIMSEFSECPRTLERTFIKRAGVSPKTLMRIVRLDYLWTRINDYNAVDYHGLVFDGHYFDQAHFINDFKSIIGEVPGFFFNRNLELVKMFSGRVQGEL